ncbi:hypothetical protein [Carnobacterium inhibens]|uniref:Uncharacterized protein n=1 Tax=Carnobacterium inhibens subsp. gilichinskyi TaxID=1266845 RepID=U5SCN4_9LACT|nr:hypothetical protein [Carnobacterium inhibens]AGY83049.1 hypothetical protein Q783_12155 [Carnobacterium inhibens subsp. gilichinskyi]
MSSYIYLSSDTFLPEGAIGDKGLTVFQTTFYPSLNSMESFFFENNYDTDEQKVLSFSKHFSSEKYQVASIDLNLPENDGKKISKRNKKALEELFGYIKNHFDNSNASYVEILFCLNGFENDPLQHNYSINYNELSANDLLYEELKFLTIKKQD